MRKVFFEIVDSSSSVEKEAETTAAPTVPAIPEAISTDPVFQVIFLARFFWTISLARLTCVSLLFPPTLSLVQEIAKDAAANDQQKRGFRAYDPRQSQVYAHKYNDANSNWYYFRRGY